MKILGKCEILGVEFKDTNVIFKSNKILPIEKGKGTKFIVKRIGKKYNHKKKIFSNDSHKIGTRIWDNTVDEIINSKMKKILIIGPTDAGKSTFSLFLANKFLKSTNKLCIIDGDIGQGDLAPPGCIGAALLSKQVIDLRDLKIDQIRFVGSIQPRNYESRISWAIENLSSHYSKNNIVTIINTDGYVRESGIMYKMDLIRRINPDCIVYINDITKDKDLIKYTIQNTPELSRSNCMYITKPSIAINKSSFDRKHNRITQYIKFLTSSKYECILPVQNIHQIYYRNNTIRIKNNNKINAQIDLKDTNLFMNRAYLKDRFIGLSNNYDHERILGFGIIKDFINNTLYMQTSIKEFDNIFISEIKLFL